MTKTSNERYWEQVWDEERKRENEQLNKLRMVRLLLYDIKDSKKAGYRRVLRNIENINELARYITNADYNDSRGLGFFSERQLRYKYYSHAKADFIKEHIELDI